MKIRFMVMMGVLSIFLIFFLGVLCQPVAREKVTLKIQGDLGTLTQNAGAAEGDITLLAALIGVDEIELEMVGEDDQEGEEDDNDQGESGDEDAQAEHSDDDDQGEDEGEDNDNDDDVEFEGPYVVDLLEGAGDPVPESCITEPAPTRVPAGDYEEIEVETEVADGVDPNCPISGHSVYVRGNVECGGNLIPFTYVDDFEEEFSIEGDDTFHIDQDTTIVIVFHLDQWFVGVDLCSAEVTDGQILIDEEHNQDLQDQIEENIQASTEGGEDEDEDGDLDEDEDLNDDEDDADNGCFDGIDNDGDGLVDADDPDCQEDDDGEDSGGDDDQA